MGLPHTPTPPHLYPQALQLKLYQAFIFSVPILFSIILLLLFYLFYLKRRRDSNISSSSSSPAILAARRLQQPSSLLPMPFGDEEVKERLAVVMFNEDLRDKDSQCCVCLGDFELNEQLHQIPSCKHLFHIDCIHHWLKANYTCPLCRCYIYTTKKLASGAAADGINLIQPSDADSNVLNYSRLSSSQQVPAASRTSLNVTSRENTSQHEGSTSGRTCLREAGNSSESRVVSEDAPRDSVLQNSVVIQIEMHPS